MGEFRRNTLPNLDSAGMYQVNTKGTDYKVDTDKAEPPNLALKMLMIL